MNVQTPQHLLGSYQPQHGSYDEIVRGDGDVRPFWQPVIDNLDALGTKELLQRQAATIEALDKDGVTYHSAKDDTLTRRRWQLDALPILIPENEWHTLESGVQQRCELLNLILEDLYGPRLLLSRNNLPFNLILSDPMFLRPSDRITIPAEKQLFLSSSDLVRSSDGEWTLLSDRTQVPSGSGYAMENRSVISKLFPGVYRSGNVRLISTFFEKLRLGLATAAPAGVDEPRAVVLSPGVLSETAFEHAFLAAELGIPLVEGSDLVMRDGAIWMHSISGLKPVHVILRRVDGWFCDPLELQGDSQLGVAGLNEACRQGTVSVVNPIGSGICENNGLNAFMPDLARRLLGEDLTLRSAESWWCGDKTSLSHVETNLTSLVIRPTSRLLADHAIFGPQLNAAEANELRDRIKHQPHLWVGQELVDPATAPTFVDGSVSRRRSTLRTFAVADGHSYYILPGGLTRVARDDTSQHVTNRSGAAAKDTWVLQNTADMSGQSELIDLNVSSHSRSVAGAANLSSRAAENLFWIGRYSERAESAARLIRAVNHRRLDFQDSRPGPGVESLAVLLRAITHVTATFPGFSADELIAQPLDELFGLIVDSNRSGSVRHSIDRLLAGSEVVREQLSPDNWLVAGSLQQHLIDLGSVAVQEREEALPRALEAILSELLALSGIGAESSVRDEAWCYLDIGRRIERSTQILRLLRSCLTKNVGLQTERLVVLTALSASESTVTYRRRYRSMVKASSTLELLVYANDNPRSVVFQVERLSANLALLDQLTSSAEQRPMTVNACERAFEILRESDPTKLQAIDSATHNRQSLVEFTDELSSSFEAISTSLSTEDFPRMALQQPITIRSHP